MKHVAEDKYCFTRTSTECDEQTKKIEREVCTYTYASKKESLKATTVKVGAPVQPTPELPELLIRES